MSPEEKIKEAIKSFMQQDLTDIGLEEEIKNQLEDAFTDGIMSVQEDSAMLDHPDCPDFEEWWKGEI